MSIFEFVNSPSVFGPGMNAFAGAALGASFYVLVRTQPYLVNRSFDPKYNAVYLARFITGVIAGVILATIGPSLFGQTGPGAGADTRIGALTPGVLAILGGFAAEAVEQILQRLVDVMLTAVRGDGSAQAQAKITAEQAQKNVVTLQQLAELETKQGNATEFKATLESVRNSIRKATAS